MRSCTTDFAVYSKCSCSSSSSALKWLSKKSSRLSDYLLAQRLTEGLHDRFNYPISEKRSENDVRYCRYTWLQICNQSHNDVLRLRLPEYCELCVFALIIGFANRPRSQLVLHHVLLTVTFFSNENRNENYKYMMPITDFSALFSDFLVLISFFCFYLVIRIYFYVFMFHVLS